MSKANSLNSVVELSDKELGKCFLHYNWSWTSEDDNIEVTLRGTGYTASGLEINQNSTGVNFESLLVRYMDRFARLGDLSPMEKLSRATEIMKSLAKIQTWKLFRHDS